MMLESLNKEMIKLALGTNLEILWIEDLEKMPSAGLLIFGACIYMCI